MSKLWETHVDNLRAGKKSAWALTIFAGVIIVLIISSVLGG